MEKNQKYFGKKWAAFQKGIGLGNTKNLKSIESVEIYFN